MQASVQSSISDSVLSVQSIRGGVVNALRSGWSKLSHLGQRRAQCEMLRMASSMEHSRPGAAARLRKAALTTWD